MSQFLDVILGWSGWPVYVVVGALVFAEAAIFVGLVLPGETALLIGAVLAARGGISLPVLVVVSLICAVAGDSVGYAVGRIGGPSIEQSRMGRWIGPDRWAQARTAVQRHGAWAVFAGRWIGVLRALVPSVCGVVGMPYRRFLLGNVAGAATWVVTVIAVGYVTGGSLSRAGSVLGTASGVVAAAVLVGVLAWIVVAHRRGTAAAHSYAAATSPDATTTAGHAPAARRDGLASAPETTAQAGHAAPSRGDVGVSSPEATSLAALTRSRATTDASVAAGGATASTPPESVAPQASAAVRAMPRRIVAVVAAASVFSLAAVELADAVHERDDLAAYDPAVTSAVVAERSPALTDLGNVATFLASEGGAGHADDRARGVVVVAPPPPRCRCRRRCHGRLGRPDVAGQDTRRANAPADRDDARTG